MSDERRQQVEITGFDIPFGDWVVLLVKLALAAIPAAIILVIAGAIVAAVFGAVLR